MPRCLMDFFHVVYNIIVFNNINILDLTQILLMLYVNSELKQNRTNISTIFNGI